MALNDTQRAFVTKHLKARLARIAQQRTALDDAMAYLVVAARLEMPDPTLEDILAGRRARAIYPPAPDIEGEAYAALLTGPYKAALAAADGLEADIAALKAAGRPVEDHLADALQHWASAPTRGADWFADQLDLLVPAARPSQKPPELAQAIEAVLARKPLATFKPADFAAFPGLTPGGTVQPAPASVLDDASREALYGTANFDVNVQEDYLGTGGIQSIRAVKNADGSKEVTIAGEILPGLAKRRDLQSRGIKALNAYEAEGLLRDASDWERLHLWGPGFGDEAAAGIYLGPEPINQEFQNRGVEALIRHLGALVLPFRAHGYRLTCAAEVTTWPASATEDFVREPIFRMVEYTVRLVRAPAEDGSPQPDLVANAGMEMKTPPDVFNETGTLDYSLWGDSHAWAPLFAAIPEALPG